MNVDKPAHYMTGRIEVALAMDILMPPAQWLSHAFAYAARAPFKGSLLQDLRKAVWCVGRYNTVKPTDTSAYATSVPEPLRNVIIDGVVDGFPTGTKFTRDLKDAVRLFLVNLVRGNPYAGNLEILLNEPAAQALDEAQRGETVGVAPDPAPATAQHAADVQLLQEAFAELRQAFPHAEAEAHNWVTSPHVGVDHKFAALRQIYDREREAQAAKAGAQEAEAAEPTPTPTPTPTPSKTMSVGDAARALTALRVKGLAPMHGDSPRWDVLTKAVLRDLLAVKLADLLDLLEVVGARRLLHDLLDKVERADIFEAEDDGGDGRVFDERAVAEAVVEIEVSLEELRAAATPTYAAGRLRDSVTGSATARLLAAASPPPPPSAKSKKKAGKR